MKTNTIILIVVVLLVLAGIGYAVHLKTKSLQMESPSIEQTSNTLTPNPDAPAAKVSASTMADGQYYVRVIGQSTNPEDTVVAFEHVTYLEGEEARATAEAEAGCGKSEVENCAPSLALGYYVQPSGAPSFTAPLAPNMRTAFVTTTAENVYVITLSNGMVTAVQKIR